MQATIFYNYNIETNNVIIGIIVKIHFLKLPLISNNCNTHIHILKMRSSNRLYYIYYKYHWNLKISDSKIFEG